MGKPFKSRTTSRGSDKSNCTTFKGFIDKIFPLMIIFSISCFTFYFGRRPQMPGSEVVQVPDFAELVELAREVGQQVAGAQIMCATAESCTGGLVGHLLTEIPGSSVYFAGGAVVYSYEAKERVVGVDRAMLLEHGAVSAPVAQQMAQGARRLYAVDVAVAITGIAGPGGGTEEKPVGTVHIHVSGSHGYEAGKRFVWNADRSGNKLLSAQAALQMLADYLEAKALSTTQVDFVPVDFEQVDALREKMSE
jgi:nicotinamide-nucleotide amidase